MLAHVNGSNNIDNLAMQSLQKARTIRYYFTKYAAMHKSYTNAAEWGTEASITEEIILKHAMNKLVVIDEDALMIAVNTLLEHYKKDGITQKLKIQRLISVMIIHLIQILSALHIATIDLFINVTELIYTKFKYERSKIEEEPALAIVSIDDLKVKYGIPDKHIAFLTDFKRLNGESCNQIAVFLCNNNFFKQNISLLSATVAYDEKILSSQNINEITNAVYGRINAACTKQFKGLHRCAKIVRKKVDSDTSEERKRDSAPDPRFDTLSVMIKELNTKFDDFKKQKDSKSMAEIYDLLKEHGLDSTHLKKDAHITKEAREWITKTYKIDANHSMIEQSIVEHTTALAQLLDPSLGQPIHYDSCVRNTAQRMPFLSLPSLKFPKL